MHSYICTRSQGYYNIGNHDFESRWKNRQWIAQRKFLVNQVYTSMAMCVPRQQLQWGYAIPFKMHHKNTTADTPENIHEMLTNHAKNKVSHTKLNPTILKTNTGTTWYADKPNYAVPYCTGRHFWPLYRQTFTTSYSINHLCLDNCRPTCRQFCSTFSSKGHNTERCFLSRQVFMVHRHHDTV